MNHESFLMIPDDKPDQTLKEIKIISSLKNDFLLHYESFWFEFGKSLHIIL
jgi:hypothetical protein